MEDTEKTSSFVKYVSLAVPIIGCALGYWVLDSILDSFVFNDKDFFASLLKPDLECLYMRLENIPIITVFVIITEWSFIKRKNAEKEREKLSSDLENEISKVKVLSGLLPICASCKKIKNDQGYWDQIEAYISKHSEAEFTHGVCPECTKKLYPEYYDELYGKKDI